MGDMEGVHRPPCKISCQSIALLSRNPQPDRQNDKITTNLIRAPYYVWRVIITWSSAELSRPAWSIGDVVIGTDDFLSWWIRLSKTDALNNGWQQTQAWVADRTMTDTVTHTLFNKTEWTQTHKHVSLHINTYMWWIIITGPLTFNGTT